MKTHPLRLLFSKLAPAAGVAIFVAAACAPVGSAIAQVIPLHQHGDVCATPAPPPDGLFVANTWPGGIVYYDYHPGYPADPRSPSPAQRAKMDAALAMLQDASGLQFVVRTTEPNYVRIRTNQNPACGSSFSTAVGMTGIQQQLEICTHHWDLPGILMHEMMHALGFWHEQQRRDRFPYIDLHPSVATNGNYTMRNGTAHGPYDFASVMHYQWFGAENGDRAIMVKPPFDRDWQYAIGTLLDPNATLSNGDVWALNAAYPGGALPPRAFDLTAPASGEAVGSNWSPSFAWQESEQATGYRLLVDDSPLFDTPEIDVQTTQPSYIHPTALDDNRLYFWRVVASNANGTMSPFPRPRSAFYTSAAYPATLFVDDSAPPGGDGANWATPLNSLPLAVETAYASEGLVAEIRVAQGVYTPDLGSGDRSMTFWLADGCAMRGGFAGFGATDPNARDIDAFETVLSGDLNGDDLPGFLNTQDNTLNIVTSLHDSSSTLIEGFTIRGGRSGGLLDGGAGVLIDASDTTIRLCRFESNDAQAGAGLGIVFWEAAPVIEQSVFTGNRARNSGGIGAAAILQATGQVTFDSCVFENNVSQGGSGAVGLVFAEAGFVNSLINGNAANAAVGPISGGGAIGAFNSSHVSILNTTIVSNSTGSIGGGVRIDGTSSATIGNAIVWSNTPDQLSGAPVVEHSNVQGGATGAGNINLPPVFVGSGPHPYALAVGAPVIDAGSNLLVPAGISTDLAGEQRFLNDPVAPDTGVTGAAGGDAITDMGAYERLCYANCDNSGALDIFDFLCFQNSFVNAQSYACDCDTSSGVAVCDIFDFLCFQSDFVAGCP